MPLEKILIPKRHKNSKSFHKSSWKIKHKKESLKIVKLKENKREKINKLNMDKKILIQ